MEKTHCLVFCTLADREGAEALARFLVEQRFAACVNILPGVTSIYRWEGDVQRDTECMLIIKTRQDRFAALSEALRAQHPYELPEIVAVPLSDGLPAYLAWIDQSLEPEL